jgi:hypothetical protein
MSHVSPPLRDMGHFISGISAIAGPGSLHRKQESRARHTLVAAEICDAVPDQLHGDREDKKAEDLIHGADGARSQPFD